MVTTALYSFYFKCKNLIIFVPINKHSIIKFWYLTLPYLSVRRGFKSHTYFDNFFQPVYFIMSDLNKGVTEKDPTPFYGFR